MAVGQNRPGAATEQTPLLNGHDAAITQTTQETQITADNRDGTANGASTSKAPARQIAPDLLRGLLMIFMAIDHFNVGLPAYPHGTAASPTSEHASQTIGRWTVSLGFALRILSHLCAPGFGMLLGLGIAFFIASRNAAGWSSRHLAKHILFRTAGIAAANAALTVLVINRGIWFFNIVLYALAANYLLVGLLAIALLHVEPMLQRMWTRTTTSHSSSDHAFHFVNALLVLLSAVTIWWNIWLDSKHGDCSAKAHSPLNTMRLDMAPSCPSNLTFKLLFYPVMCGHIASPFPPLAWTSFSLFGLLYGRLLWRKSRNTRTQRKDPTTANLITLEAVLSVVFALLFVATRIWQFGNLSNHCIRTPDVVKQKHLSSQYLASFKAFFYTVKYPPSPSFAFMTMSANFALLVIFSLATSSLTSPSFLLRAMRSDKNPLLVYGRQSLFFYVVHLTLNFIISPFLLMTSLAHDVPARKWDGAEDARVVGLGPVFFLYTLTLLAIVYPLCAAYARFKARQPSDSIWRFF